ncbi:ATP-binding protein [Hymenobacter sp. BT507]|uniref:ATP-binding protein n=1 Tax=Hymenobacter citatus TaxID=2763506 RepID=A0ABR7MQ48_9BACT|nr:ATP-binding protein [Hymenobacter citatus]MBC6613205.1 ATP-binding protein [Hymenobacter citatus]
MKSDTLKRLFRSIQQRPSPELLSVARGIVEDERRKGHLLLVMELEGLLHAAEAHPRSSERTRPTPGRTQSAVSQLTELPLSRRYQQPLLKEVPRPELRHHMILPGEVESRFARIEREYVSRDRLAEYGLTPRRKILLYGPPGCGKSMGAERLAWNIGLPFFKVQFDTLISSFLGESANNLRTLFEATQAQPCVLLLDECDFIAKSRTYGQDVGEMFRLVNMLLSLLEDYQAPGLLVATTNLEHALDKALFRRFDEVLSIPRPGQPEIDQLLRNTLGAMRISRGLNLGSFAKQLIDLSAAQVVKIAQDAAKLCILALDPELTTGHLQQAFQELSTIENE